MELWIRSQDRESLIKVSNIQYTYKNGDLYTDVRGKHYIGTYYDNFKILGTYKTKERALEVLDEIQKYLEKMGTNEILTDKVGILNGIKHYGIVYEMPKE